MARKSSWRTNPSIQQAKGVAEALNKTAVVMLLFDQKAGTLEMASYGIDGKTCDWAGNLGDVAMDAVEAALNA